MDLRQDTIKFLRSLSTSELTRLLSSMDQPRQIEVLKSLASERLDVEHDKDLDRKRKKRSEAARIVIPDCVDPQRRERALADPELFLMTYFPERYRIQFGPHHLRMIDVIYNRAKHGGRQAVAAPRGCGKSEVVKGLLAFLILAGLVRFPLAGGATTKLGKRLYSDFRTKVSTNDLLLEDFPEICYPVRALEGAPQRAAKQHVDGSLTNIVWTSGDYLRLPDVPGSAYGGIKMSYFGLDSAFRGFNIDGDRPDFILLDDPETRESAKSYDQSVDREEIIDNDIAGLASQEDSLSIVVLTTVQNCYCLSYRITDPKIKPAFNGMRYGMIEEWPTDMDRWSQYVSLRHKDQSEGDEHGLNAIQFYLDNRDDMDTGVVMLSDHFVEVTLDDGSQLVHSAIQQAFNKIADTSLEAYKTEYQNNPTPEDNEKTQELTAAIVANRLSGFDRNCLPAEDVTITMGLDIGDHYGHWVKMAWFGNATGIVIDYGVMEVPGYVKGMGREAKEISIYKALLEFCSRIEAENPPEFCLIDSGDGDHTNAVYSAILELGGNPWAASKGWDTGRFKMPVITLANQHEKRNFNECFASRQTHNGTGVWLYQVNTEYWKHWLHARFVTPTFSEESMAVGERVFNDGSVSLFQPQEIREHQTFSHHMVAEYRQERFEEGKGWVRKWYQKSKLNHYLDAAALACASAGVLGIKIKSGDDPIVTPTKKQPEQRSGFMNQHGQPFLITERK